MTNETNNIILIIIIITFMNVIALTIIWSMPDSDSVNKVDCYDKYSHKITGQTCEEIVIGTPYVGKIILSALIPILITLTTITIFPLGDLI